MTDFLRAMFDRVGVRISPCAIAICLALSALPAHSSYFAMGGMAHGGYSDMQSFHISMGHDEVGVTIARIVDYVRLDEPVIEADLPTSQFALVESGVTLNASILIGFDYYHRVSDTLRIAAGLGMVTTEQCNLYRSDNTGQLYCSGSQHEMRLESSIGIRQQLGQVLFGAGFSATRGGYVSIGAWL